jgi:predicted unusual protein kinase regulating ubiquinone biosynthesis (AarF/ABC1/UbiB family)
MWNQEQTPARPGWWQSPELVRANKALKSHPHLSESDFRPEALLKEVSSLIRKADGGSQIAAFTRCLEMLRLDGKTKSLSHPQRERLARTASRLLSRAHIGSHGSKLSRLHDELFEAIGARLDLAPLSGLARSSAAETVGWLRRTGEAQTLSDRMGRIERLRHTADFFQAEAELEELAKAPGAEEKAFVERERLCQAVGRDADLSRVRAGHWTKELSLWAYAVPERTALARVPKSEDALLQALESAYNLSLSKPERWARILRVLEEEAPRLEANELALALAAAVRWLLRNREKKTAVELLRPYRELSRALCQGFSADVLSLFGDLSDASEKAQDAVPVAWKRAGALSSLSVEVCALLGRTRFASLFGKEQKKKRLREQEAAALVEICVRHLSELKGPLMKIGQTASYFGFQLPAISTQTLIRLQSESAPLAPGAVVAVLERELGRPVSQLFAELEETPCGVGSIGQVHRARLRNGERVAVKVQFPGIEQAVRSDVTLLRLCYPVIRLLSASAMRRDVLDELEAQLLNECDYRNEARVMKKMAASLSTAAGLRFPKVVDELVTKHVLVTEYVEGQTFQQFAASATQEERNEAGRWITEYVVRSCCRGTFNSDPHPGNFLFADGKLICLDFGAVKEWDPKYSIPWAELILAGVTRDYPLFVRSVKKMGVVADERNFNAKYFFEVYTGGPMGNMTVDEPRGMTHEELHRELTGYFHRSFLSHAYFQPQYLYGVRVYSGLVSIIASLRTQNNFFAQIRDICLETLP